MAVWKSRRRFTPVRSRHVDEFCAPYASVIDIDKDKLPAAATLNGWSSEQFVSALRHDQKNPALQSKFPPIIACQFQSGGENGGRYTPQRAPTAYETVIAKKC